MCVWCKTRNITLHVLQLTYFLGKIEKVTHLNKQKSLINIERSKRCHHIQFDFFAEIRDQRESRWSLGINIFCPVLFLKLRLFFVSVSVSSLKLRFFSLGLVIETRTFVVSVLSLRLTSFQSLSCH